MLSLINPKILLPFLISTVVIKPTPNWNEKNMSTTPSSTTSAPSIGLTRTLSLSQFYTSNAALKSQGSSSNLQRPTTDYLRRRSSDDCLQDLDELRQADSKTINMLQEQLNCVNELLSSPLPSTQQRHTLSPKRMQK